MVLSEEETGDIFRYFNLFMKQFNGDEKKAIEATAGKVVHSRPTIIKYLRRIYFLNYVRIFKDLIFIRIRQIRLSGNKLFNIALI